MGISGRPDFRENDTELLKTGNLADGTIKCKGRTWKVHRVLLASRLAFFKAAFFGSFAEATSGEIDLPEADPDSVDLMLQHLYGQVLSVKDLKTPLLCVRCWKLADYLQLESFKSVATSSLEDHLDAMALLASNDLELENINPKWLRYFLDAFREVCADKGSKKLHETFITFLWVTRFEMLQLSKILEILERHPDMNRKMLDLLVWNEFLEKPDWLPNTKNIEQDIQNRKGIAFKDGTYCARCVKELNVGEGPRFYNPFPAGHSRIGQLMWCKRCTFQLNESRDWPWRNGRQKWKNKFPIEAWSWSDEE